MSERKAVVDVHNRLAGELVTKIVMETVNAGGNYRDVMVLTESVLMGVVLTCVRLGGDEKVLDVMVEGVKARLAEARLKDLQTAGRG
jgi:hypothetical protein